MMILNRKHSNKFTLTHQKLGACEYWHDFQEGERDSQKMRGISISAYGPRISGGSLSYGNW
jgi:hypothetical protein